MNGDISDAIRKHKLIVIVRNVAEEYILPLAEAMYNGGVRLIEVTINQTAGIDGTIQTCNAIRLIKKKCSRDLLVGAGTVLTGEQVRAVSEAGAAYIISPNTNPDVIQLTKKLGLVSIPGALSPTEIERAHSEGADFVKLFPVDTLGLTYAKAIMGPLNHIPLLAVGGVDTTNLKEFLAAGFCGVGVGGNIVKTSMICEGKFNNITELARQYTTLVAD